MNAPVSHTTRTTPTPGRLAAPAIPHPRAAAPGWWEAARVPAAPGGTPLLATGVCFDALRLPAAAGTRLLARTRAAVPALGAEADMWLLIAEGAAEEVPGLLRWLEWGTLPDEAGLVALGAGARLPAPAAGPAVGFRPGGGRPGGDGTGGGRPAGEGSPGEAAVWLRPPVPGRDGGLRLPTVSIGPQPTGGAPDLVRLVDAAATECHRALLRRQPLAFS